MKKLLLIVLLNLPLLVFAQLDSLLRELPKKDNDTNKIALLLRINSEYSNAGNFDSALIFLNQANKLAQEKKNR